MENAHAFLAPFFQILGIFAFPLAIGLASSVTHCAAMCGPIHLFLARQGNAGDLRLYHLGRILTYAGMGMVAGGVGRAWQASAHHGAAWVWAAFYVVLGLKFLGIPMWPAHWEARYSQTVGRVILAKMTRHPASQRGFVASLLPMGMAAGLLPCASTQAGLAWAAGSSHAGTGALGMLLLGFGTLPLFAVFPKKWIAQRGRYFHVFLGASLIALAAWKSYGLLFAKTYSCH